MIVATLVFSAVGCGKGGIDGKIDELGKIRDSMCACKDKTCTDAQQEKYIAWKKGNKKDEKPDESQMKKFEGIRKELQDCRHKLDEVPPVVPPPATPPTAGSAAAPGSAAPAPAPM